MSACARDATLPINIEDNVCSACTLQCAIESGAVTESDSSLAHMPASNSAVHAMSLSLTLVACLQSTQPEHEHGTVICMHSSNQIQHESTCTVIVTWHVHGQLERELMQAQLQAHECEQHCHYFFCMHSSDHVHHKHWQCHCDMQAKHLE